MNQRNYTRKDKSGGGSMYEMFQIARKQREEKDKTMTPSPAARRAAERVISQYHINARRLRLISGVNTTDTEILHGIATIIEQETHVSELVAASGDVEEAYGCECLDSEPEPHCPMCNLRAVLDKVK